ncbi:hypothetical protein [Borreliella bissettiae]|uniref:hypothetical protein n=1 Tax=Borrelia bissettiae TaxID=64897 RepID=UPI00342D41EC
MHLLLGFVPDIHPSKFINTLTTVTSRFIIKKYFLFRHEDSLIDIVKKYIQNQNKSIYWPICLH